LDWTEILKVIFASKNKGKIKEVQSILKDCCEVLSLVECGFNVETIEDGNNYEQNAVKKALDAIKFVDFPVLADDSGLEVEYLKNLPGIHTSRFAGLNATDEENIEKLLFKLKDVPKEKRKANFVCVAVVAFSIKDVRIFRGECSGHILAKRFGICGFGFDSVFRPENFKESMAEISEVLKNKVSHRAKAFLKLKNFFKKVYF
jgi:XTP/dITP diphosphohydrolase